MPTLVAPLARGRVLPAPALRRHDHWYWLAAGLVLFFLIPFTLTDLVAVDRDLYYGVYVTAAFGFFAAWARATAHAPEALLRRNLRRGVLLGLVFAGVMAAIALRDAATPHPHGLPFAAAIAWRGVLYGLADGLILSAFPILAVFAALGPARGRRRRAAVGALALAASLLFTAVYHAGYTDFRGAKLRKPLVGDAIWSLPTLATLSPFGAPVAHAGLHVAAVVHSYDTTTFLPPHPARLDGSRSGAAGRTDDDTVSAGCGTSSRTRADGALPRELHCATD